MPLPKRTISLAVLSSRVTDPSAPVRAGAIAAFEVTAAGSKHSFSCHTHIPTFPAGLNTWLDDRLADRPTLVGYELARMAGLLTAAGYRRHLVRRIRANERHEIRNAMRGTPMPLATAAVLGGIMAAEEGILRLHAPIPEHVAADLALLNALAGWVIHIRGLVEPTEPELARDALGQLGCAMADGATPAPLAVALAPRGH